MKIKRIPKQVLLLLLLGVVVFISYGQTLKMYFWLDDYTYLYYAQQGQLYRFPYQLNSFLTNVLFQFFGLESRLYFLIGILLYVFAVVLLYYLIVSIIHNKLVALFSVAIFAAGYIGQDAMKMFIGDGLGTLTGLNILLLGLISLFRYFGTQKAKWIFITYVCFLILLEIAPYRYGGIIFVVIAADWLFSWHTQPGVNIAIRNIGFLAIFLTQYILHPSKFFLDYQIQSLQTLSVTILNFHWRDFAVVVGSFWNILVPDLYQTAAYFYLVRTFPSDLSKYLLLLTTLPLLILSLFISIIIKKLKGELLSWSKIYIYFIGVLFLTILLGGVIQSSFVFPNEKISMLNGFIVLVNFFLLYRLGIVYSRKLILFSIILSFALLTPFLLVKPEFVIESSHRYLLPSAIVPSLLISFFVTKELVAKDRKKKSWALILFILPIFLLVSLRLLSGYLTQRDFIESGSLLAKKFYRDFRKYIPRIEKKSVFYFEGDTPVSSLGLGNALRVGALPSEAAIAVHYNTKIDNIVVASEAGDIPRILRANQDIEMNNVFYFIFDGERLHDVSPGMRSLLMAQNSPILLTQDKWRMELKGSNQTTYFSFLNYTLGVYPQILLTPKQKIPTQLPLGVKINLRAKLDENLRIPYYHLFRRREYPTQDLWQEILSWEIGQCQLGHLKEEFECVVDRETARSIFDKTDKGKMSIAWDYNTYGPIAKDKFVDVDIILDGKWHEYGFIIHNGGEYLKNLMINYISFPGTIEVGDIGLVTLYE